MRSPLAPLLKNLPWEGFLLDGLTLVLAFFLWEPAVQAVVPLLPVLFWLIAPVHLLGVWAGIEFGSREKAPPGRLWKSLLVFKGLAVILALGGFLWLFVPATAIEAQTGHFPGGFVPQFFLMLFGGILVCGLGMDRNQSVPRLPAYVGVSAYLLFTELLFAASAETGAISGGLAALVLGLAYFPMRYSLALRPPYSLWEVASATLAFVAVVRDFF